MQAIMNGNLNILVILLFPTLLVAAFLMRRLVSSLNEDVSMAKYILERGPEEEPPKAPDPKDRLPGYTFMTKVDYDEIYAKVEKELNLQKAP